MTLEQMAAMVDFHRRPLPVDLVPWAAEVLVLVDSSGFKYVNRAPWAITTAPGVAVIRRAALSDGSSGPALDRCPRAFWAHDKLYLDPRVVGSDGKLHAINRHQADLAYARILLGSWMPLDAAGSLVGLTLGGGRAWRRYKRLRKLHGPQWLLEAHSLPHARIWELPSSRMIDIHTHHTTNPRTPHLCTPQ